MGSERRSVAVAGRGHEALAGVGRIRVLQALRAAGPNASVNDIATPVGLHPNTVRWHLDRLVQAGLATRASAVPNKPGRPPIHFTATPKSRVGGADAADEDGYRLLARILASYLATVADAGAAAAAGESYGRVAVGELPREASDGATATGRVVRLLDDMGFEPEPDPERQLIRLHACPFREVAEAHPEVVCETHLGLMRGAFAALGAPVQTSRIEPFTADGSCLAYLTTAAPAARPTRHDAQWSQHEQR